MAMVSAGLLIYRLEPGLAVLLVHPGGPFWASKDLRAWSIPKGEIAEGEDLLAAARREVQEEIGLCIDAPTLALGSIRQKSGKVVHAWATRADFDPTTLRSNTFELEWPRGSGHMRTFPEVDRAEWFDVEEARRRILPAQEPLLDRLLSALPSGGERLGLTREA